MCRAGTESTRSPRSDSPCIQAPVKSSGIARIFTTLTALRFREAERATEWLRSLAHSAGYRRGLKTVDSKESGGHSRSWNGHARAVGYADRVCLLAELWWCSLELLRT